MAQRTETADAALINCKIRRKRFEQVMRLVGNIADNFVLTADMPPVIVLGASAARDVLMPANDAANDGLCFTLLSNSTTTTGVLTLKTSADAALAPAVTIAQNLSVEMIYIDGIGWRKKAQ